MFQMLMFPFRLLFFIVLTIFRIIGFFFGVGVRSARFMAGSSIVLGLGVLLGLFLGKKSDIGKLPSRKNSAPAAGADDTRAV
jgi:hypothetical protein